MASTDKSSPKSTYWTAFFVSFVGMTLAGTALLNVADHWLLGGGRWLGGASGALALPVMVLSGAIAGLVCRRRGVSLASHAVVVITRGQSPPTGPPEPFEMRFPTTRGWVGMSWLLAAVGLIVLVMVLAIPSVPGTAVYGYLLAAGFGLAAAGRRPQARLRRPGGRPGGDGLDPRSGFGTRSVGWDRVGSCEVTVRHDTLGRLTHPRFVFKDRGGAVALRMDAVADAGQTGQFKDAVARYLSAR